MGCSSFKGGQKWRTNQPISDLEFGVCVCLPLPLPLCLSLALSPPPPLSLYRVSYIIFIKVPPKTVPPDVQSLGSISCEMATFDGSFAASAVETRTLALLESYRSLPSLLSCLCW